MKVSCDEFPFNTALEGGIVNGAVVKGVPEIEQSFQSSLQNSVSSLLRIQNDARTQWKKAGDLRSQFPGMCHKYLLVLSPTRPLTASLHAVGSLDTGGAWLAGEAQGFVKEITNSRAIPPPPPLPKDTDYLKTDVALYPSRSYRAFNCSPCAKKPSTPDVALAAASLRNASMNAVEAGLPPTVTSPPVEKRQEKPTCTKTMTSERPTDTEGAQMDSEVEAAAAAAAAATAAAGRLTFSILLP